MGYPLKKGNFKYRVLRVQVLPLDLSACYPDGEMGGKNVLITHM